MDTAVLTSLISAVTTIVLAVIAAIVAPVFNRKLNEIHTLANDNLNKANTKIDTLGARIEALNSLIAEMRVPTTGPVIGLAPTKVPVPVTDDRVAEATERMAEAVEKGKGV